MAATRADIRGWLERAAAARADFLLVVTDTFGHEDYPVFSSRDRVARQVDRLTDGHRMTMVAEVYDLSLPIEAQLDERRAWHLP